MKYTLETIRTKKLLYQRNIFFVTTLGLLVNSLLLGFLLIGKSEKIVIIPSHLNQPIWLEGNKFSASYLEENAVFLIGFLLNNNPSSAGYNRELLLRHVSSESYGTLKTQLLKDEELRKKQELATNFIIQEIKVESDKNTVILKGLLQSFVMLKKIAEESKRFKLSFEYQGGKLLLQEFSEIKEPVK